MVSNDFLPRYEMHTWRLSLGLLCILDHLPLETEQYRNVLKEEFKAIQLGLANLLGVQEHVTDMRPRRLEV